MTEKWKYLDAHLRLRLADLDSKRFEDFFLHFLNAGIVLTIQRNGQPLTRRVISAETYAAGSGKDQKGIDLRLVIEGNETWSFQCKRHKKWSRSQTRTAIQKAQKFEAKHCFLAVACDPSSDVHDEVASHADCTLWNLDRICEEFRLHVPPVHQPKIVSFLDPAALKLFVPFATQALISPEDFFAHCLGGEKLFRHDWKLVGRDDEMVLLNNFVADSTNKVLLLVSKGGDGKSRLLLEFTRNFSQRIHGAEALFFNPHSKDEPTFAFLTESSQRLLLIDDAHRTEVIPVSLLTVAARDPKTKIILATRPQGIAALGQKLFEAGLADAQQTLPLPKLKKSFVKELAKQALGSKLEQHAPALAELTKDCPFLTVLAGDLLRQEKLRWGGWASLHEFRQHVFRAFEEENLQHIRDAERETARGLLRLVALVAPISLNSTLVEKAVVCLGSNSFQIEALLRQLRRTELIVGNETASRIVPDLLADFLVYDTCFEPASKMPVFVQRVLEQYVEASSALLRNLAESAWVAQANGVLDDSFIRPLIEAQQERFKESSFYARSQQLIHLATFCVYLPRETLELARLAIEENSASPSTELQGWGSAGQRMDSHSYVLEQVPSLLTPIAKHHSKYLTTALDILWELGCRMPWQGTGNNQYHPWAVIGDVIKFEPRKSVDVTRSALGWFEIKLKQPGGLAALETSAPLLKTLIGHCFDRFVEFAESDGRTFSSWTQPVSLERTQILRDHALRITDWVLSNGSWMAALDALSILHIAIRRVAPIDTSRVENVPAFRAEWRSERLKALAVYETALTKQSHVAVRYEIRRTLKQDLRFEEDPEFIKPCLTVIEKIPDDLKLRVVIVILSHDGYFEFDDEVANPRTKEGREQSRKFWLQHVAEVAKELVEAEIDADQLFRFLHELGTDLKRVHKHPFCASLFQQFAKNNPEIAGKLAERILQHQGETPLGREWFVLIGENKSVTETRRLEFLKAGARSQCKMAGTVVVSVLFCSAKDTRPFTSDEESILLEIAHRANHEETWEFVRSIRFSKGAVVSFAFQLLELLPLDKNADALADDVFDALSPDDSRPTNTPAATVEKVLSKLVRVRRIDLNHGQAWHKLCEAHPKAIYHFVYQRIQLRLSGQAPSDFHAIPHGYRIGFDLLHLKNDPEFVSICEELWSHVQDPKVKGALDWRELFQAVALTEPAVWMSRMLNAIGSAESTERLSWLVYLIKFDGSLMVFRFPTVTRAFLIRAETVGNEEGRRNVRASLYNSCGPGSQGFSNGVLDKEDDYVEAEAKKAAEAHANDSILGPFYRWIVEAEQHSRVSHRMHYEASMASLD